MAALLLPDRDCESGDINRGWAEVQDTLTQKVSFCAATVLSLDKAMLML